MFIVFVDESDRFIVVYLDNMIVFSRTEEYHLKHLQQVFKKFRRCGLSLNPKKYFFDITKGKILEHIVFKGVRIDLERVQAIQVINFLRHKKEVWSFLEKIIS